jgi:hypothetical protein
MMPNESSRFLGVSANTMIRAVKVGCSLGDGTTKPHLVECENGQKFCVKFPTEDRGCQLLVNELLAAMLLERIGLPTPPFTIVDFPDSDLLIEDSAHETIIAARKMCDPLMCFGSQYMEGYREVLDGSPGSPINEDTVTNLEAVAGAVVFDSWVFNQDARHFLGRLESGRWHLLLFDNDGAFNRDDWKLGNNACDNMNCTHLAKWAKSKPRAGDISVFENHLKVLEDNKRWHDLQNFVHHLPSVWLNKLVKKPTQSLCSLLVNLDERRKQIRGILAGQRS